MEIASFLTMMPFAPETPFPLLHHQVNNEAAPQSL